MGSFAVILVLLCIFALFFTMLNVGLSPNSDEKNQHVEPENLGNTETMSLKAVVSRLAENKQVSVIEHDPDLVSDTSDMSIANALTDSQSERSEVGDVASLVPAPLGHTRPSLCSVSGTAAKQSSVVVLRRFDGSKIRLTPNGDLIHRELLTSKGSIILKSYEGLSLTEAIDRESIDVHLRVADSLLRFIPKRRTLSGQQINRMAHRMATGNRIRFYRNRPMATKIGVCEALRRALLIRVGRPYSRA